MERNVARAFEVALLVVVLMSVGLGVTWANGPQPLTQPVLPPSGPQAALPIQTQPTQSPEQAILQTEPSATPASGGVLAEATSVATVAAAMTATRASDVTATSAPTAATSTALPSLQSVAVATPVQVDLSVSADQIEPNDAPLLEQAPGTMNILLLGSDSSADARLARTDSIMVASINPGLPSVSLLSFPRDLTVRFPGGRSDRINTVFEYGYINKYPSGGPGYLSLMLRKNFGIKIDHFVRINFGGFIKAVDALGGVDVIVECELHETFPDKESPRGRLDLDFYPGKMTMNGKAALGYSRARMSTSDFDRARRQQKVLRAILRKAREGNLLQNALSLYADFRQHIETDIGPLDLPAFIDMAQRLDNVSIKSRVVTWPVVRSATRSDGASVLIPTDKTLPYVAEALAPPSLNQVSTRPVVEVYNGSSRETMELVAAERLAWEGFQVAAVGVLDGDKFEQTQIFNYKTSKKDSPIARLQDIFKVKNNNVLGQPDPNGTSAARIVLGEDYNSCPNTAWIAADVVLGTPNQTQAEAQSTPAP